MKKRAFTVVETVVAAAIALILVGALYSSFFSSFRTALSGQDEITNVRDATIIFYQIRRDVEALYHNPDVQFENIQNEVVFDSDSSRLLFYKFHVGKICRVEYVAKDGMVNRKIFERDSQKILEEDTFGLNRLQDFRVTPKKLEFKYEGTTKYLFYLEVTLKLRSIEEKDKFKHLTVEIKTKLFPYFFNQSLNGNWPKNPS